MSRRVLRVVIATVLLSACHSGPKYTPLGGLPPKLEIAGTYDVKVTVYSSTCAGYAVHNQRVVVDHSPGAAYFKLTLEERPYDGNVRSDGSFTMIESKLPRIGGVIVTNMNGKFSETGFYARVFIKEQFSRTCEYQLRWEGFKL